MCLAHEKNSAHEVPLAGAISECLLPMYCKVLVQEWIWNLIAAFLAAAR